jgi:hypothetical protein
MVTSNPRSFVVTRLLAPCAILIVLAATGCASAKSGATADTAPAVTMTPVTQRIVMPGDRTMNINTTNVNAGYSSPVVASMDSAWAALKAAYNDVGIPVKTQVDATHLVGNEEYKARRRIGKILMQDIFDCGSAQGLPNAETFDITMSISSYLAVNPKGGLTLVTRIDASGKSPSFSNNSNVKCSSQCALEKQIGDLVRKKVGS